MNNNKLIKPKSKVGFEKLFQYEFFLKSKAHKFIEILRLINAINPAKACIKPVVVGGTTGTSVGNIPANDIPTQKIPKEKRLFLDAFISRNNPISSSAAAIANVKNAKVINQLKLPTAYSLRKQVRMFLSGRKKWRLNTIIINRMNPKKLISAIVLVCFIFLILFK